MIMLVLILLPTSPLAGADPDQGPTIEMSLAVEPAVVEVFPTHSWTLPLNFIGSVTVTKYRPDDLFVDVVATVNQDWYVSVQPQTLRFSGVGTELIPFKIQLMVPSMTVGPLTVTVDLTASARVVGRSIEDTTSATVYFIEAADEFVEDIPERIAVLEDGGIDGTVIVYNLLDREMEFHLCVLGEWEEKVHDLDFQNPVVLGPNQMIKAGFHGQLDDAVGPGEYEIEFALWTPGEEGERTYITSQKVTLVVTREGSSVFSSTTGLAIVLFVGFTVVLVILLVVKKWDPRHGIRNMKNRLPRIPTGLNRDETAVGSTDDET